MTDCIYFVQRDDGAVKIGTTVNIGQRLSALRTEHGPIKPLGIIKGGRVKERILHWCLADSRLDGEWFELTSEIQDIIDEYAAPLQPTPRTHTTTLLDTDVKTLSLKLTDEQLEFWRQQAIEQGFISKRGPLAGGGHIQGLIEAIADGKILIAIWPSSEYRWAK